jgi:hypothetical protein
MWPEFIRLGMGSCERGNECSGSWLPEQVYSQGLWPLGLVVRCLRYI